MKRRINPVSLFVCLGICTDPFWAVGADPLARARIISPLAPVAFISPFYHPTARLLSFTPVFSLSSLTRLVPGSTGTDGLVVLGPR